MPAPAPLLLNQAAAALSSPDGDGLTAGLAGLERALSVSCPRHALAEAAVVTQRMRRYMRRDFYFVSVGLFFARGAAAQRAGCALREAAEAARGLEEALAGMPPAPAWPQPPWSLRVRLLSPRCAALLRLVCRIDAAISRLLALEAAGLIDARSRRELARPALAGLAAVKRSLIGKERP